METAPTAAAKPAALDLRKSLLACFAAKEQGNDLVLSSVAVTEWKVPLPCGKSRSIAALATIHHLCPVHLGQISMLAQRGVDPTSPKIGFGFWESGALRAESAADK